MAKTKSWAEDKLEIYEDQLNLLTSSSSFYDPVCESQVKWLEKQIAILRKEAVIDRLKRRIEFFEGVDLISMVRELQYILTGEF